MFESISIEYPRVSDYVRYTETYPELMGSSLKEVQRAWVFDKLCDLLPDRSRVIDLGGSSCELADYMSSRYQMTVVDPYDGSGNGPKTPEHVRRKFPHLNIIQGFLDSDTTLSGYDAVVSSSVVEHIPVEAHASTVAGIYKALKPGGFSIHSIDLTVRGVNGFMERFGALIESFVSTHRCWIDIDALRREMLADVETYYLSPAMYNQWRKGRPFKNYPWRQVSSVNFVARKLG